MRGGGDLASGVAIRLHRAGIKLIITELSQPLAVRRLVSFAEAIYSSTITVEDITACHVNNLQEIPLILANQQIPVIIDPHLRIVSGLSETLPGWQVVVIVDARLRKRPPETTYPNKPMVVGLGPGFIAGENCQAVIETKRGPWLGRVIWVGSPEPDTGIPEMVIEHRFERVLRAPQDGLLSTFVNIGEILKPGQPVAEVASSVVTAPFEGLLRGLLPSGITVQQGLKIGDIDPRLDPRLCTRVSDKALAVGGGVLEAILSKPELRNQLWDETVKSTLMSERKLFM